MLTPEAYYTRQKEQYNTLLDKAMKESNRVAMLRLWSAIGALAMWIWAFRAGGGWRFWPPVVLSGLFLVFVNIHNRLADKLDELRLHLSIIDNELRSLNGDNTPFADGSSYTDITHAYTYDLDIFGKGSVYQMLCRIVTLGGATSLAEKLSTLVMRKEEITMRQDIVHELSTRPELLQNFRVAGMRARENAKDHNRLIQWLTGDDMFINNQAIRIAAVVMPVVSAIFLIWSFIIGDVYSGLTIAIVVNWMLLGSFQKKIKPAIQQISNTSPLVDKYEQLMQQVAMHEFKTPWLHEMHTQTLNSLGNIDRFKKLIRLFESRSNIFIGPVMNSLFLFDFYCLLRLEAWRKEHKTSLLTAIDAMIAIDVYVSCAVYAFNHPENIFPQINTTSNEITAKDLRHPLLSPKVAVGNDVSIGNREQFYLLTGANMTGKSTFIRTVGVCNVLCNLGLPLPAKELSLPLMQLYTSMRITDSVQDDVSYFRAELNRIKMIMDTVRAAEHRCLVLLDEPLRGTNSTDKQQGTRSIVETLLTFQAMGIVATHDTGLCDMEINYPGKVSNYHFESTVDATGLSFDFRIKPGGSVSNNATILMKQMGIVN